MLESGRWLEPTLAGRPHWTKPPLTYWAIAAGYAALGTDTAGARLPSALAYVATVLVVAAIGRSLWGPRAGWLAGLVYLSSLLPVVGARTVSTDMLLTLWETVAVLCWVRARETGGGPASAWWVRGAWLAFGAGFLTKGPVALLPLLAILVLHLRDRRGVRLADPLGLAGFALVGLGWYAVEVARTPGLLAYLLGEEVVGRDLQGEFGRNPQWYKPFVIYLPALLAGEGLWLLWGARLAAAERLFDPRRAWRRLAGRGPAALLLLWLLLPLAVFFVATSRLPLYVLPLYAPIALAIGRWIDRRHGPGVPRGAVGTALVSVLLLVVLAREAAVRPSRKDMRALHAAALRAAGGPPERWVLYGDGRLYGFQFYADRPVERASDTGREEWADGTLAEAADRAARAASRVVFVAPGDAAPEVEAALDAAGAAHERRALNAVDRAIVSGAYSGAGGVPANGSPRAAESPRSSPSSSPTSTTTSRPPR